MILKIKFLFIIMTWKYKFRMKKCLIQISGLGGYIDKKPGFCPPAKEYGLDGFGGGSIQDLYFGLRHHHDKKHVTGGTGKFAIF